MVNRDTSRVTLDVAALRGRHPHHFDGALRASLVPVVLAVGAVALLVFGLAQLGFLDGKLISGLGRLVEITGLMLPPDPGGWAHVRVYVVALFETIAIALLGTLAAAILAVPLGLLAARNVTTARVLRFLTRRSLDTIRSVDILIWALIWIGVVGLGPFAGVLAFATSDIGSFGKLFSEAIEAADRKPVEGITSAGGGRVLGVRFGLLPEVFPVLASQILYFFESNVRSASILGVVGAGGIGLQIAERIKVRYWDEVSFIIILLLVTVALIDQLSARVRRRLID
jgi:phosphonate transport system permease protein